MGAAGACSDFEQGNSVVTYVLKLTDMKHLLTLAALLVSTLSLAQQMPYNPDANGDDFVGVDDVLGVLGVYDTALMQPNLECNYEGTDLEQLVGGLFDQSLVLDSVYVEYLFSDSVLTYLPGCPDAVYVETILERSYVINDIAFSNPDYFRLIGSTNVLGNSRQFEMRFYPGNGLYRLYMRDNEIEILTNFGWQAQWVGQGGSNSASVPFPENWTLNADGIVVDWESNSWIASCESFRLIPFWHEAE